MGSLAQLESAFASSDDRVVASLAVLKKSFSTGVGSVAKRFVPKTPGKSDVKPRVLAVTVLRHVESRSLIGKLHVLKSFGPDELRLCDTWNLKQLTQLEIRAPADGTRTELIATVEGKPLHWTCGETHELESFVGCLLSLSKETLRTSLTVSGVDPDDAKRWMEAYKSKHGASGKASDRKERNKDEATSSTGVRAMTKEEQQAIQEYLDTYDVDIGDVTTLERRIQQEIEELEAENVYALLERVKQMEPLRGALDACDSHLEDLEAWMAVFNVKLANMRQDIQMIEERNSDLETSSRNNSVLIKTLTEFTGLLEFPEGLEDTIRTCRLGSDEDLANATTAAQRLQKYRGELAGEKLEPYRGMRAVLEQQEFCAEMCGELISKTSAHLKSLLEDKTLEAIGDGLPHGEDGLPCAPNWEFLHRELLRFTDLMRSLGEMNDRSTRLFLRVYCAATSKLLRHQIRDSAAQTRKAYASTSDSRQTRLDKAYAVVLQHFVGLLVRESSFISDTFGGTRDFAQRSEDVRHILDGLEAELLKMVDWVASSDTLLCVPMLGTTARALISAGERDGDPLCATLNACQERIQQRLFMFLDEKYLKEEKKNIAENSSRSVKSALRLMKAEECNIIKEVALPTFLMSQFHSYEDESKEDAQPVLNATYKKLLGSVFKAIERAADADVQRSARIRLVNYAQLEANLTEPATRLHGVVEEFMIAARQARNSACTLYVSKTAESQFGTVLEVAHHMHSTLETGVPVSELPLQPGCSREAVYALLRSSSTSREKSVEAFHQRVSQHLAALPFELFDVVWRECTEFVVGWFAFLDSVLATHAYESPMVPTPEDLRAMFQRVNLRASS